MSYGRVNAVERMNLNANLKTVLRKLADAENDDDGLCVRQNDTLASEIGYSVSSIIRITQKLCKLGLISKINNGRAIKYTFHFEKYYREDGKYHRTPKYVFKDKNRMVTCNYNATSDIAICNPIPIKQSNRECPHNTTTPKPPTSFQSGGGISAPPNRCASGDYPTPTAASMPRQPSAVMSPTQPVAPQFAQPAAPATYQATPSANSRQPSAYQQPPIRREYTQNTPNSSSERDLTPRQSVRIAQNAPKTPQDASVADGQATNHVGNGTPTTGVSARSAKSPTTRRPSKPKFEEIPFPTTAEFLSWLEDVRRGSFFNEETFDNVKRLFLRRQKEVMAGERKIYNWHRYFMAAMDRMDAQFMRDYQKAVMRFDSLSEQKGAA